MKKRGKLQKLTSFLLVFVMLLEVMFQSKPVFAENGGSKLSTTDIKTYSFDIIDGTHGGAKIDYKTQGEEGYNDYLNDPKKFTQPVGKDQKESELSIKLNFQYGSETAIKEGDTLEIPASLGTELAGVSFPNTSLRDGSGNELGSYSYNQGKFVLNFSGNYIKTGNVKNFSTSLNAGSVKVPNTTEGTGTEGEKTVIYGKILGSTIVAGYEKKNKDNPTGPGPLSLDNVEIKSFKIIDVSHGDAVIDYRTSENGEYDAFKNDPSKFSNAICEGQKNSNIKLDLSISYTSNDPIKEGDTLTIPANYGGELKDFSENPLPVKDGNNILGTWIYKDGEIVITFGGDYIKNSRITKFNASFETGQMTNYALSQPKTTRLGERISKEGTIGKHKLVSPFEKYFVKVNNINHTVSNTFKAAITSTDNYISWALMLRSDYGWIENQKETYMNSYMLEHDGAYSPKALTDIYIEDTFTGIVSPPTIDQGIVWFTGIDDSGKLVSGMSSAISDLAMLKKIDQGSLSKEEVKNVLQKGEYCIYYNHDSTYTLMLKWWDTNSGNGLKYDDLPEVSEAGGVGNLLKQKNPGIYSGFSDETIEKINQMYRGKSIQNIDIRVSSYYNPVREITDVVNNAYFTTEQHGTLVRAAKGKLTPPAGIGDAPADPLSIKLIKSDRKTGAALSNGFKFELQTTTDNGTTWTKVNVDNSMMEKGTLNGDGTVTPDDEGIVQLKKITVGKYRFFEKAHPAGYGEVKEDNSNPNSTKYPKSANSKVIELDNQGTGAVVAMYNEPNAGKVEVKVNKKWEGPEKESVTVKLLADGKEVPGKTLTLNKAGGWEGKFTDLDKLNVNGGEIKYDVAEVNIDGYESKKTGDAKVGFTFTNKNTETVKVSVEKKWEGEKKDSVEIKLLADGNEVAGQTLTLNEGNDWKGEFINLAKYNKDGSEIKYSISEINIPFYKSTIAGDAQNGFIVTNKHVPPTKEVFRGSSTTNIDGKVVQPGEELTYAITYTNTTGEDVKATIEDKIPNHTKFVSAENGGTEKDGVVTWNIDVAKDKSVTVKFKVKVNDDVNGAPIDNEAKVNDGKNDFTTNETHNPTPTKPVKTVFKGGTTTKIDGKVVQPESELTYAVTYKNTTGEDVKATITDKIPAHTSFVSAENGGKFENGVVTWIADVKNGESVTVKFTVKVDKDVNGAPIDNVAKVNDGKNDFTTNETHNPTPTKPVKDVFEKGKLTISIDGKTVKESQELTYKVTYKNTTGKDQDVTITDKIPEHTTFVEADNGGQNNNGVITWKKVGVKNGESFEVTFTVKVNKVNGEIIRNKAKVVDGVNSSDTNEVTNPMPNIPPVTPPTKPVKDVFKASDEKTSIDGKQVNVGDILLYKVSYKNTTGKDQDVTITDKIPEFTEYVEGSANNGGIYKDGVITWTKEKVADKETFEVTFKVKVKKSASGKTVENEALVRAGANESKTNKTTNPVPKPENPKTGDTANTWMYLWALLTSGGLLTLIGFRRKKHAK